jgi:hypothetical protein
MKEIQSDQPSIFQAEQLLKQTTDIPGRPFYQKRTEGIYY